MINMTEPNNDVDKQHRNDTERIECDECDWYYAGGTEKKRVKAGIYHEIGQAHTVSEYDLLERYDRLVESDTNQENSKHDRKRR